MINEREDRLFKRWMMDRPGEFSVKDGVLDEKQFRNIVFLLKEVSGTFPPEADDLRVLVRKQLSDPVAKPWLELTQWAYGLISLPNEVPWEKVKNLAGHDFKNALLSVALVNIKKTRGALDDWRADETEVTEFSERASDSLCEQLAFYNARLIVCCGPVVAHWIARAYQLPLEDWARTSRGIKHCELPTGARVLRFLHPSYPLFKGWNNLAYYAVVDAAREVMAR
jgi:hypothetical protein